MYEIVQQWPESLKAAAYQELSLATRTIALLGTVAAGEPLEPIEDGIRDGDVVVVKRQSTAENGQTVVAVVNGEATIKQFYRHEDQVELRPADPMVKSIVL